MAKRKLSPSEKLVLSNLKDRLKTVQLISFSTGIDRSAEIDAIKADIAYMESYITERHPNRYHDIFRDMEAEGTVPGMQDMARRIEEAEKERGN